MMPRSMACAHCRPAYWRDEIRACVRRIGLEPTAAARAAGVSFPRKAVRLRARFIESLSDRDGLAKSECWRQLQTFTDV